MAHQHCSSYTMPKNYNNKKCPKAKITTWPTLQCPKFQQEQTTTQWQCLNIKLSIPNVKFSISSFKFLIPNLKFSIPNFKFSIPNSKFSIPNFKILISKFQVSRKKNLFQGTTKIRQAFHANEKIQIKKEQMEITHLKNNGTTKPSSYKV